MKKSLAFSWAAAAILDLSMPTDRELLNDLNAIRDPKEGGAKCPKCGRHFKTDSGLAMHMGNYHPVHIGVDFGSGNDADG